MGEPLHDEAGVSLVDVGYSIQTSEVSQLILKRTPLTCVNLSNGVSQQINQKKHVSRHRDDRRGRRHIVDETLKKGSISTVTTLVSKNTFYVFSDWTHRLVGNNTTYRT